MTYALILAVLSLPAGVVGSLFVFTRYVAARDARDASERAQLYQRLQAPETAVAMHAAQSTDVAPYLPFEDDGAFISYQQSLMDALDQQQEVNG